MADGVGHAAVSISAGGYPWTIVRTTQRKAYLDALEAASAEQNSVITALIGA